MGRRELDELEVIDLTSDGHVPAADEIAPRRAPFRWRRPAVIVPIVVVAVVAAVVGPVRAVANTRALERMEHILVVAVALEEEADDRSARLVRNNPTVGDAVFLGALRTLTTAYTAELRGLRSGLPRAVLLGDRLRTARTNLRAYLHQRIVELEVLGREGPSHGRTLSISTETMKHRLLADRALADERKRRGGERDEARLGDAELPSLDDERAALRRPTDDAAGLSLIAATDDGLSLLDLDSGRTTGGGFWHGDAAAVVSGDTVAWLSDSAWFEPTGATVSRRDVRLRGDPNHLVSASTVNLVRLGDLDGPAVRVERVITLVRSPRPGAVWLQELATDGRMVVREVDVEGATLIGPVPLPADTTLFGATEAGLVLDGDRIVVWRPTDSRVVRLIGDAYARPRSLGGDTLLWARGRDDAQDTFITYVSSGVELPLVLAPHDLDWVPGAVSPDGTRVALISAEGWRIDELASGAKHEIPGEAMGSPAWSPDGKHVLLPTTTAGYRQGAVVGTVETLLRWDVESRKTVALRLRANEWPYWGFAVIETP